METSKTSNPTSEAIEVVAYDQIWPHRYKIESAQIQKVLDPSFLSIEHVGSTAIPGLDSKPIIDMMASVARLSDGFDAITPLTTLGYLLIETGMPNRLFLRKRCRDLGCSFHLHIVEEATWHERNERILRDYLLAHPETSQAYGELKHNLAIAHAHDGLAYTKGKTDFIQSIVDIARNERGLPCVKVWEE
jgi:GrpB-like predicted nucleotidyltransferase (UPF0157 family)